ncbi:unnamed protein product [Ostreobium quekettii]|uniref:VPS9 domain-containing protein n=1 Tax=Ostreobium quekettii TaxID=121088 RepID=A0A8S1J313_9CHLO|nr:unnamed protein product [Ostreobium quekettii]
MSNDEDPLAALTTPVSFQRFLELMKNDSARDLVRKINRFLQELNEARQDPHRDSAAFQKFLSQMEADFRKHRLWRNQPREELDTAMEGLEKYLLTKLHSRTFARYPEDTERDHLLSTRLVALHFVRPHHLDIPDNVITNETLLLAVKELQKMNVYKAPRDKLVCILNCCRVIQNLLKTAGKAAGGADIFVPVLNYVVIRAAPEHMISNVEYIRRFRMKSRLSSHTEYYFMQLSGAAYFTETADAGSFTDGRQEFLSSFLQHGLLTWPQYEEAITQGGPPKSRAPPMPTIAGTNPAVCQSLMDTAITAGAPAGQQAGALDRSTGGGSQVAPADLESWNSVLTRWVKCALWWWRNISELLCSLPKQRLAAIDSTQHRQNRIMHIIIEMTCCAETLCFLGAKKVWYIVDVSGSQVK